MLSLILVIYLLIVVLISLKKGPVKTVRKLINKIMSLILAFVFTRIIIALIGESVADKIIHELKYQYDFNEIAIKSESALKLLIMFVTTIGIALVLFYVFYFCLRIITCIINGIIYRNILKEKFDDFINKFSSTQKKIANCVMGAVCGIITIFVLLMPIATMYKIIIDSVDETNYEFDEEYEQYTPEHVIAFDALNLIGATNFCDALTKISGEKDLHNSDELCLTTTILLSCLDVNQGGDVDENIEIVHESFDDSIIIPRILSEIIADTASMLIQGEDVGELSVDPNQDRKSKLLYDSLFVFSECDEDSLKSDVDTTLTVYSLIVNYENEDVDEDELLLYALSDEEFTEELFLTLYRNSSFVNLLSAFVNFGLGSSFDKIGVVTGKEYSSDVDFSKMTEEEVVDEADHFSKMIKLSLDISEKYSSLDESSDEVKQEFKEALDKSKNSRLLNDLSSEELFNSANAYDVNDITIETPDNDIAKGLE